MINRDSDATGGWRRVSPAVAALVLALAATGCQTTDEEKEDDGFSLQQLNPFNGTPDIDTTMFAQFEAGEIGTPRAPEGAGAKDGTPGNAQTRSDGNTEPEKEGDGEGIGSFISALTSFGAANAAPAEVQTAASAAEDVDEEKIEKATGDARRAISLRQISGIERAYEERLGIVDIPEVNAVLEEAVARIQAVVPGDPVAAKVRVEHGGSYSARADRDGTILINFGALKTIGHEAELLWLLAHEYAHLHLNHFADSEASERTEQMASLAAHSLVLRMQASGEGGEKKKKAKQLYYPRAVDSAVQAMFIKTWNRKQEMEADLFAIDVLAALGYPGSFGVTAIGRIGKSEKSIWESFAAITNHDKGELKLAARNYGAGDSETARTQVMELGVGKLFDLGTRGLSAVMGETHPSPRDRAKLAGDYVEAHHKFENAIAKVKAAGLRLGIEEQLDASESLDTAKKAFSRIENAVTLQFDQGNPGAATNEARKAATGFGHTDPAVRQKFARIRQAQGNKESMFLNYTLLERDSRMPLLMHKELLILRLEEGQKAKAKARLEAMAKAYPGTDEILPLSVRTFFEIGDEASAEKAFEKCKLRAVQRIVAACDLARRTALFGKEESLSSEEGSSDPKPSNGKNGEKEED